MNINERFTLLADLVTEFVGKWWFTAVSLLLLAAWTLYGILAIPNWFTSAQWNFPANSITTLGEWFMEGLVLAAANRVEKRNRALQEHHQESLEQQQQSLDRLAALEAKTERQTELLVALLEKHETGDACEASLCFEASEVSDDFLVDRTDS